MTNKTEVKFLDINFTANGAAFVFWRGFLMKKWRALVYC